MSPVRHTNRNKAHASNRKLVTSHNVKLAGGVGRVLNRSSAFHSRNAPYIKSTGENSGTKPNNRQIARRRRVAAHRLNDRTTRKTRERERKKQPQPQTVLRSRARVHQPSDSCVSCRQREQNVFSERLDARVVLVIRVAFATFCHRRLACARVELVAHRNTHNTHTSSAHNIIQTKPKSHCFQIASTKQPSTRPDPLPEHRRKPQRPKWNYAWATNIGWVARSAPARSVTSTWAQPSTQAKR